MQGARVCTTVIACGPGRAAWRVLQCAHQLVARNWEIITGLLSAEPEQTRLIDTPRVLMKKKKEEVLRSAAVYQSVSAKSTTPVLERFRTATKPRYNSSRV